MGSGPDPPCSCRGISTDARDRVGKSPIEAIRRPELWVSTVLESGLVLIICDGIAAPGPFRIASWRGLRLGSRFGVWGLRFETLPQTLCLHFVFELSPSATSATTLNYDAGERRSRRSGLFVGNKATRVVGIHGFGVRTCSTSAHFVASARWLTVLLLRSLPWVQARIHPAAVAGLVLMRGIASGSLPLRQ